MTKYIRDNLIKIFSLHIEYIRIFPVSNFFPSKNFIYLFIYEQSISFPFDVINMFFIYFGHMTTKWLTIVF